MNELIKKYLPYCQFGAVVLTIVLGIHTGMDRFLAPKGPVVAFDANSFLIEPKLNEHRTFLMHFNRKKLRDDCALNEFRASVLSDSGFTYEVKTTVGKSVEVKSAGFESINYFFYVPNEVPKGTTKFSGLLIYSCKEGIQTIYYPNSDKLTFEIK